MWSWRKKTHTHENMIANVMHEEIYFGEVQWWGSERFLYFCLPPNWLIFSDHIAIMLRAFDLLSFNSREIKLDSIRAPSVIQKTCEKVSFSFSLKDVQPILMNFIKMYVGNRLRARQKKKRMWRKMQRMNANAERITWATRPNMNANRIRTQAARCKHGRQRRISRKKIWIIAQRMEAIDRHKFIAVNYISV